VEQRYAWLWDVDLDAVAFEAMISGSAGASLKDRQWAMVRLIEYAPWNDIRRLLPRGFFLEQWPSIAPRVRSRLRRAGMNFLHTWYQEHSHA